MSLDKRSLYLRRLIFEALEGGGGGHIGPSLSLVEILRVLYDEYLNFRAEDPLWEDRDRLILSKGHGCLALYALLADKCFFKKEHLLKFCHTEALLGGHPEKSHIPGVEASTGSLGHGLSIGVGVAQAARIKNKNYRVVVVTGDGELNEGAIWEAALHASKHNLTNLIVFVDYNKHQCFGAVEDVSGLEPLKDKWEAFGFCSVEVDGHDVIALTECIRKVPYSNSKPTVFICHTVKGKGLYFAEDNPLWHYRNRLSVDDLRQMEEAFEDVF